MKSIVRSLKEVLSRGLLLLLILQMTGVAFADDVTYQQREAIWQDFSTGEKAIGISSKAFQELMGNDDTKEFFEQYGNAVTVITVSKELLHTGDLEAAARVIKDKLQDKAIEKITPGFHSWLGWITWAKTGMELFKDIVFDPMVEQSQLDTYFGVRDAGSDPENAFASVRGLGYIVERGKKEFRKQYGDMPFQAGTNELLPRWEEDFQRFIRAGMELKYQEKLHQDAIRKFQAAAAEAEAQLPQLREQLLLMLQRSRVGKVVLEPATTTLHPGEQVSFTAIAVYADQTSPRSSDDVTRDATWSGGTSDNIFTARESDVGKTVVISAQYAGLTGSARVAVERSDCGDHGRWDTKTQRCECDSGYVWNEDLGECVGEERAEDTERAEVLADMEHRFYDAVTLFDEHYDDFIALLKAHGSASSEDICADQRIAFSFARAAAAYDLVDSYYFTALDLVGRQESGLNWDALAVGDYEPDINTLDQIRLEMFHKDYHRVQTAGEGMPAQLAQFAPGCDPEEMLDAGARITDVDQDPESGVDGPGATTGGGGGGGGGGGELRFEQTGSPVVQEDKSASCTGGSMSIDVLSYTIPQTVYPDGSYHVSVTFTWSTSGSQIDDVDVGAGIFWFGELREDTHFASPSGTRTFSFTISGAETNFNQLANSVTILVGGGILCSNTTSDGASINITQPYIRQGGN